METSGSNDEFWTRYSLVKLFSLCRPNQSFPFPCRLCRRITLPRRQWSARPVHGAGRGQVAGPESAPLDELRRRARAGERLLDPQLPEPPRDTRDRRVESLEPGGQWTMQESERLRENHTTRGKQ